MPETLSDVMTRDPIVFDAGTPVIDAARAMRDDDTGDVLVERDSTLVGILTDRDIVVRGVAEDIDASSVPIGDLCSGDVTAMRADDRIEDAARVMREQALRRLPVVEDGGRPVGIVSIGDLAVERDPGSVLGDISAAAPNN
jgi:CBS domain-containing protein